MHEETGAVELAAPATDFQDSLFHVGVHSPRKNGYAIARKCSTTPSGEGGSLQPEAQHALGLSGRRTKGLDIWVGGWPIPLFQFLALGLALTERFLVKAASVDPRIAV